MRHELSYENVKAQLRLFLSKQDVWKNYDLDATGIGILVNLLAYEEHRLGTLAAMLANEAFLDTAQLPDNVIRAAKALGYVARSATPAVASLKVVITEGADPLPDPIYIPKGTVFTGMVAGGDDPAIPFVVTNTVSVDRHDGVYTIDGLQVVQGEYLAEQFVWDSGNPEAVLKLPKGNVVIDSIEVYVDDGTGASERYQLSTVMSVNDAASKVFYVDRVDSEIYGIYFGEGIAGATPPDGARVLVTYMVTNGEDGNGYDLFAITSTVTDTALAVADWDVTTLEPSHGGAPAETPRETAMMAKAMFGTQNRAVTAEDYQTIIRNNFPAVADVITWGGDTNDPPVWGKILVCVYPKNGGNVPESMRKEIADLLDNRLGMVTSKVEIVRPNEIFVIPTITALVDLSAITVIDTVRATITDAAMAFMESLGKFGHSLYHSDFVDAINDADPSINGVDVSFGLAKKWPLPVTTTFSVDVSFNNAVVPGSVKSSTFMFMGKRCFFEGTADGTMTITGEDGSLMKDNVGMVDHAAGTVKISPVVIGNDGKSPHLVISATPVTNNIMATRNVVLTMDRRDITVDVHEG